MSMSKNGPLDVSLKALRVAHYMTGCESGTTASTSTCINTLTPTRKCPKLIERASSGSPTSEKKCPVKVTELEIRVSELQEDLKKTKNDLAASELFKRRAQQELEEAKKHLTSLTARLEETQNQLKELSESEDDRIMELRKLGQERDRAWQSELEAMQLQQKIDCDALSSAMNEIQKLRVQLENVGSSEAAHATRAEIADLELRRLKDDMAEMFSLLKAFRRRLQEYEESEAEYQDVVKEKHMQLEAAESTIEKLQADGLKMTDSLNSSFLELHESNARVCSLEELVRQLQSENQDGGSVLEQRPLATVYVPNALEFDTSEEQVLRSELHTLRSTVGELRLALEASEMRYQEDQVMGTVLIQSACEALENYKFETGLREAGLEFASKGAKLEMAAELKAKKVEENESRHEDPKEEGADSGKVKSQFCKEENKLDVEIKKLMEDVLDLKASLTDKERELQIMRKENDFLKSEMGKNDGASMDGRFEDNNDMKGKQRPEAAHLANSAESEVELKRLRIHSEQWRKAAELATAFLVTEDNGRWVDGRGTTYSDHYTVQGKPNSPILSDESQQQQKKKKKKKKLGVLWRKGQK